MKIDWKEEKLHLLEIHEETLQTLSIMYEHIQIFYGNNFRQWSKYKCKKVRRNTEKNFKEWIKNQIGGVAAYFDEEESDIAVLTFLQQCYEENETQKIRKKQLFDSKTQTLPPSTAAALWELTTTNVNYFTIRENSLVTVLNDNSVFRRTLILCNVSEFPQPINEEITSFEIECCNIAVTEDGYSLSGVLLFWDNFEPDYPNVQITFSNVVLKTECYCGTADEISDTPWEYLGEIAVNIYLKSITTDGLCNAKEQELLPLLKELAYIRNPWEIPVEYISGSLPHLTALANQYGYKKLLPLIANIEKVSYRSNKYDLYVKRLINALCHQSYEPLWRDIWNRVIDSQQDYPSKASLLCPADILQDTQVSIQRFMEKHGYEGTYPDFVRKAPLQGIHLEGSYDMNYFVGMKERATYHIHCSESVNERLDENEYLTVQFLCGTSLSETESTYNDIYSCLFNAGGKRFFHIMRYNHKLSTSGKGIDLALELLGPEACPDNLEQCVTIAVKKNQLKKLTKEERKLYRGYGDNPSALLFYGILFIGGILFAACMMLAATIMEFLATVIFGQLHKFPEMFLNTPWLEIFLFCCLGFGIPMAIIFLIGNRK